MSGDGPLAVAASGDWPPYMRVGGLKVWEVESGLELCTLHGHTGVANGVTLSRDGRLGASASTDHTLKVWDLASGSNTAIVTFSCETAALCCAWIGRDKIIVGDAGGRVYFLELVVPQKYQSLGVAKAQ